VSTSHAPLVIVVEDDEGMRQAMRRVLEAEGFVTEVFNDAEAMLATGAASRASCLVLDIQLPGMSGIALHRHLQSLGTTAPTVFVTARDSRSQEVNGTGTPCLLKPFPSDALVQAVNRSISR
jgi:FixJ family two-component response regulator